jgi:hypothetical protein
MKMDSESLNRFAMRQLSEGNAMRQLAARRWSKPQSSVLRARWSPALDDSSVVLDRIYNSPALQYPDHAHLTMLRIGSRCRTSA